MVREGLGCRLTRLWDSFRREQYVLGFYPERARHNGSWRKLSVRVRTPGAQARCREGYVDY